MEKKPIGLRLSTCDNCGFAFLTTFKDPIPCLHCHGGFVDSKVEKLGDELVIGPFQIAEDLKRELIDEVTPDWEKEAFERANTEVS